MVSADILPGTPFGMMLLQDHHSALLDPLSTHQFGSHLFPLSFDVDVEDSFCITRM